MTATSSQALARLRHQAKVYGGNLLGRFLDKQYRQGKGAVSRFVSVFSEEARAITTEQRFILEPRPIKKPTTALSSGSHAEKAYSDDLLLGEDQTIGAGVVTARSVDVSLPTGMHRIGNRVLTEALPAPHAIANPKYFFALESMRFRPKQEIQEGVLLTMPWHHNFYHWMIEILPRLVLYDRSPQLRHLPLIVPRSSPEFVRESLRLTGYLPNALFLDDGVYRFKQLHFLTLLSRTMDVSADAVTWLNERFSALPANSSSPKRVYVSRRDAKIRFVSNEGDLETLLSDFGFQILSMSDLSLADQIRLFRGAECIVGPHGAAFANLAFAASGSTFVEFFSRGHFAHCFNRVCGARGIEYDFLVGEPASLGGFSIDPALLRSALARALGRPDARR